MYCIKCGTPLDTDARFCPECGTAVKEKASPKKKSKLWIVALCAVILVGIVCGYRMLAPANPPASAEYTEMLNRYGFEDYSVYKSNQETVAYLETTQEDSMIQKTEYLCRDGQVVGCTWYFFATYNGTVEERKASLEKQAAEGEIKGYEVFEDYYVMIFPMQDEEDYERWPLTVEDLLTSLEGSGFVMK